MISKNIRRASTIARLALEGCQRTLKATRAAFAGTSLTVLLLSSGLATAEGPPEFFKNSLPEHAIQKMLESYGAFKGDGAVLDTKTRELIALGVSAQIPCAYCVYSHRNNALKAGASEAELREAVAAGAFVRFWSAMFQGAEINLDAFKAEHDELRKKGS